MTRLEALVALNLSGEISSIRLNKLLKFFGRPQDILKGSYGELTAVSGIGPGIANKIRAVSSHALEREFTLAHELGLKIITLEDASYPQNLKEIPDAPIVLYVKGKL
ncbi:DNA-processing protein DprA, partial [Candidatus Omnitrophota bacterium]